MATGQLGLSGIKNVNNMSKEKIKKEIKRIEKILAKEKNLNKITFYEGYLKGLRFNIDNLKVIKKEKVALIKEMIKDIREVEQNYPHTYFDDGYNYKRRECIDIAKKHNINLE